MLYLFLPSLLTFSFIKKCKWAFNAINFIEKRKEQQNDEKREIKNEINEVWVSINFALISIFFSFFIGWSIRLWYTTQRMNDFMFNFWISNKMMFNWLFSMVKWLMRFKNKIQHKYFYFELENYNRFGIYNFYLYHSLYCVIIWH